MLHVVKWHEQATSATKTATGTCGSGTSDFMHTTTCPLHPILNFTVLGVNCFFFGGGGGEPNTLKKQGRKISRIKLLVKLWKDGMLRPTNTENEEKVPLMRKSLRK